MASFNYLSAFMYLVLYLLIICFIGVVIYGVKKYRCEKRIGSIFVTLIVSLLLLFLTNQLAVCSLYFSSISRFVNKDYKIGLIYMNLAAHLSMTRSQKSACYGELGNIYMVMNDGKNAIKYYNKAYKTNGSYVTENSYLTNRWPLSAGMLYSYAGEYDKVYQIANETGEYGLATLAAIYQKDFKKALGYSNLSLKQNKKRKQNLYTQRAYIYKKLNNNKLSQENLQKAISSCRGDKMCIDKQRKSLEDSYWIDFHNKNIQKYGLNK